MLYLCLLQYVGVLRMVLSLVVIHVGNLVVHISCILFVMPLSLFLLTYIHKSGSKISLFGLVVTCIDIHMLVPNISISHIFISIIEFYVLYYS